MRTVVSGSSGLVGSALVPFLAEAGWEVGRVVRGEAGPGDLAWDPETGTLDAATLSAMDAVVHLAGENLVGLWTEAKKRRIRDSRLNGTRLLSESLAKLALPPKVLVAASAIGYYGDRGDEELDESSSPGTGFLAEVCQEWEAATHPAREAGIRVVNLRIGVVLTPRGGALGKMLGPFKAGLGGRMGSGKQWQSWIALDDLLGAILHTLVADQLAGPVNAVAPNPVTQSDFARTLGKVLRRPTYAAMPAFVARLAFGEMADEMLLASARVVQRELLSSGYAFRHPTLGAALTPLVQ